jgi:hypothetical protein
MNHENLVSRRTWLGGTAAALTGVLGDGFGSTAAARQASAPLVTRTDAIYGGAEGAAGQSGGSRRPGRAPGQPVGARRALAPGDDRSAPVQQAVDCVGKLTASGVTPRFVHDADRGHMGIAGDAVREARAFIAEGEPKR